MRCGCSIARRRLGDVNPLITLALDAASRSMRFLAGQPRAGAGACAYAATFRASVSAGDG